MKRITNIFMILLLSIFLISCKKETNISNNETSDLSKYEINEQSAYSDQYELALDDSIDIFLSDNIKEALIKFDVKEKFYGRFTEKVKTEEVYSFDFDKQIYTVDGEEVSSKDFLQNYNDYYAKLASKYLITNDFRFYKGELYVLSSLEKINEEDYEKLNDNEKSTYRLYYILNNSTNLITNTKYDFDLLTPYDGLFDDIKYNNNDYDFNSLVVFLRKDFTYSMISQKGLFYLPILDEHINYQKKLLAIGKENNQEGILLKEKEYLYFDNELFGVYDFLQDSELLRPKNSNYSFVNIFKSICSESNYKVVKEMNDSTLPNTIRKIETKYIFCPLDKLSELIINFKEVFDQYYKMCDDTDLVNMISSNDMPVFLSYNTYISSDNRDKLFNQLENETNVSLYQVDLDLSDSYYLVKNENKNYKDSQVNYYKYLKTEDIDLYYIDKVYFICKGKITKNVSNNTVLDIDIIVPIDITSFNDIKYTYSGRGLYLEVNYLFDGLLIGINNDEFDSIKNNSNIVLGADIKTRYIFDLKKNNDKYDLVLNYRYMTGDSFEIKEDGIVINGENYRDKSSIFMYALRKKAGIELTTELYFERNSFAFSVDGSKIILEK